MSEKDNRYLHRELSWLEFNQRVLDEARDPTVPLLERLKFLAISASNLDEFFMVRVGGLQMMSARGSTKRDPTGRLPDEQLDAVNQRARTMVADQYACFSEDLEPALEAEGLRRMTPAGLSERQAEDVKQVFENEILAVLTPMAVRSAEDFPLLANQTLNVCVRLAPSTEERATGDGQPASGQPRFAVIPFGRATGRIRTLHSDGGYSYILIEDIVSQSVHRFFPGEEVVECIPFRITRNADISVREELAPDLLTGMEEVLDERKLSPCVRLEIANRASEALRAFLQTTLAVGDEDTFLAPGPLDLSAMMQLADLPRHDHLKYEAWPAQPSPAADMSKSVFENIARHDLLLYHPYESFEPVLRLVEQAADDPDVLAIKQVLYRTSRNSPVVAALIRAAEQGKMVTAIVELKARFDEARNIGWAKELEQAGAQVIYGVKGLKTHAKVCIVVRREPHGIQRYLHFGTGNYNEITARIYSDVSFLTCNEELGADATSFLNAVTGYSQPQQYHKIEAAPTGLREKILEMIEAETRLSRDGQKARIAAKINSLVDPAIIEALYDASNAGVRIRLNVRGICCLRPGVKGLSENIRVISIVDRFLEHARILHFLHGGDDRVFISSADWMPRNLDRRCELLIPVESSPARERLIAILDAHFRDSVKASELLPDGSYRRVEPRGRHKPFRSQERLYRMACKAVRQAEQSKRTVFEPHRAPTPS